MAENYQFCLVAVIDCGGFALTEQLGMHISRPTCQEQSWGRFNWKNAVFVAVGKDGMKEVGFLLFVTLSNVEEYNTGILKLKCFMVVYRCQTFLVKSN